ncbi:Gldg family protein [Candidatus Venteria ishoeyi]|uniref:Gldg family protein n=1 Tax=Candidatus Venteria ishoeyi TaxID=1899563 RepID=UPI0025A613C1|nr:Gldg family protein [Candidatus Venteria ishoeyi]MDM8547515.1 Gldg family protein [Candidatus Venteria ishoeyi]
MNINKKWLLSSAGLGLAVVLFLAANIVSNAAFSSARLDLTDNGLYTLSQGSKNILGGLEEPVSLKFYLSQKLLPELPGVNAYAVRVKELLQEYQRHADGKLDLQIIEPEAFSEAEDTAVAYGMKGVPLDNSNTTFYFGLMGSNSTDGEESIPFFNPNREEFLEYDITQLVYRLAHPDKKVVGLMSSLPIEGKPGGGLPFMQSKGGDESWMIVEQMQQLFETRTIATDVTEIPGNIDVLMLVHPKNLSEQTLYALDQFVLKGGRLLAFLDPYAETDEPPSDPKNPLAGMNAPRNSDLSKLLDAWGVELVADKVVGDMSLAKKVQMQKGSRGIVIRYPIWMDLDTANLNPDDIITGKLGNITLASAGALKLKEGSETKLTPLVQSSDQAMLIETSKLGMFSNPEDMVRNFKPEGQFILAARITGTLNTAFPDGAPQDAEAKDDAQDATDSDNSLKTSKEETNLVIVADTDLLDDQFWVQVQNFLGNRIAIPQASNNKLLTNALDNLTGSNDLISVRNRGSFTREFTKVEEIRQVAENRFREKEKELLARLQQTEQQLRDLQSNRKNGNAALLTAKQQQAITGFRDEKIKIRKELRAVQHELQKDIERLEARVKFINIGLIPLLFGIGGIALSTYRTRRRQQRQRA